MANELIIFDGLPIPNGDIDPGFENIETVNKSEAATDLGNVVRLQKISLAVTLKSDGHLMELVMAKGRKKSGILQYRGRSVKARLRVTGQHFERDSEKLAGVDGLWTTSFTITEE